MARPKKQRGTQYAQKLQPEVLAAGTGEIGTTEIAADAITGAKIADDAVDSEHIADGAIDLAHMSANSIDSDQYVDGSIDNAHMAANSIDSDQYVDGSIDTAHIADDQVTNAKLGPVNIKALKFQYDFADLGGAQGAITLTDDADAAQTIPDNAIVTHTYIEGITSATSGGSATIALGYTGATTAIIAATAFDNGEFDAGAVTQTSVVAKMTAAVSVLLTVATADLTAGKLNVWVEYYEGD